MLFSRVDSLMRVTTRVRPLQCSRTLPCNMLVRCLLFPTLQLSRCSSHTKTRCATLCCGPDFWHARIDYHNLEMTVNGEVNVASALGKRRGHSQRQVSRRPPEYTIGCAESQEVSAKIIYEVRRRKLEAGWRSVRA
jgi:hypothetical protein